MCSEISRNTAKDDEKQNMKKLNHIKASKILLKAI